MRRTAALVLAAAAMMGLATSASALDITLNAVQFPERKSIDVDFAPTGRAPRAEVRAEVEFREGQAQIDISFKHMRPAVLFGGDVTSFVVWAVTRDGHAENLGELWVREESGSASYSTGQKEFALIITAETYSMVEQPSELLVFYSLPVEPKAGARNFPFSFSGFAAAPAHGMESIADIKYTGETPLDLKQAQKAYELAQRMNAEQYAGSMMREASITLAQATNLATTSSRRKEMVDYARRTVALASEAMRITTRKIEAQQLEEAIAKRKAEMAALEQRASAAEQARAQSEASKAEAEKALNTAQQEMQSIATQKAAAEAEMARLQQEKAQLEQTKAQLEQQTASLQHERDTLSQRLEGALSKVAQTTNTARGLIVNLPDILFDLNEATLKPEASLTLAKLSGILLMMPELNLRIEGYTDSTGTAAYNMTLSQQRAESVQAFLISQGVDPERMKAVGYGMARPIADNTTKEGRAKNRRVEIVIASGEVQAPPAQQ
jgi:outer membrane protein OmpA-like peptidoglycan-associated protein